MNPSRSRSCLIATVFSFLFAGCLFWTCIICSFTPEETRAELDGAFDELQEALWRLFTSFGGAQP